MDAVVFAAWLPHADRAPVFRKWFVTLSKWFSDCDLFVGINPSPENKRALQICESCCKMFRSLTYSLVPAPQIVNSDVSGYQIALSLLAKSKIRYRIVWFVHTRGMSHSVHDAESNLETFTHQFLRHRVHGTKRLLMAKKAGTWSPYIAVQDSTSYSKKDFSAFIKFQWPPLCMYHVFTFLAMKGELIQKFLKHCCPDFFSCNILAYTGNSSNRWFCEVFLGEIAWRQGFWPLWEKIVTLPHYKKSLDDEALKKLIVIHQTKKDPRLLFASYAISRPRFQ